MKTATTMKLKRGAKIQIINSVVISAIVEGEQKSYIEALASARPDKSQSAVLRDMITYWADGHKI